jgi:hypothetical protein
MACIKHEKAIHSRVRFNGYMLYLRIMKPGLELKRIIFSLPIALSILAIAWIAQTTSADGVRKIMVFSPDDPTTLLTDKPLPETTFKDDIQTKVTDYTGEYFSAVAEAEDQGYNQSIKIGFKKGKPAAVYYWKSWNDSPGDSPSEGFMKDVTIVSNKFSGRQSVSGQSTITGRFVTFTYEGRLLHGLLDMNDNLLWIKVVTH